MRRIKQCGSLVYAQAPEGPYLIEVVPPGVVDAEAVREVQAAIHQEVGQSIFTMVINTSQIKASDRGALKQGSLDNFGDNFLGMGFVVGSGVSRVVLRFFLGMFHPGYPYKVFTNQEEAILWASQILQQKRPYNEFDQSGLQNLERVTDQLNTSTVTQMGVDPIFFRKVNILLGLFIPIVSILCTWLGIPVLGWAGGLYALGAIGIHIYIRRPGRLSTAMQLVTLMEFLVLSVGVFFTHGLQSPLLIIYGLVLALVGVFSSLWWTFVWTGIVVAFLMIVELGDLTQLSPYASISPESIRTASILLDCSCTAMFLALILLYRQSVLKNYVAIRTRQDRARQCIDALVKTMAEMPTTNYQARATLTGDPLFDELAIGINLLAETLVDSLDRLQLNERHLAQTSKLAALGELISGVAHELNNPLFIVAGAAELLKDDIMDHRPPGYESYMVKVDRILHGSLRMQKIVRHFLQFARRDKRAFTPLDLNIVLQNCLDLFGDQWKTWGIELRWDLAAIPLQIYGDNIKLQQVFINLVVNARDAVHALHGNHGGIIRIRTNRQGNRVQVEFHDNGSGIAAEIKDKIFDPFFTTKEVGKGTGLGLSLSHNIIADHKGRIQCESTPGVGSIFRVELPLYKEVETGEDHPL